MMTRYRLGLAVFTGIALGCGSVATLRAETAPPAYYIALINPIDTSKTVTVVGFDSFDKLQAWRYSDAVKALAPVHPRAPEMMPDSERINE
jgi:hypothetical protein